MKRMNRNQGGLLLLGGGTIDALDQNDPLSDDSDSLGEEEFKMDFSPKNDDSPFDQAGLNAKDTL